MPCVANPGALRAPGPFALGTEWSPLPTRCTCGFIWGRREVEKGAGFSFRVKQQVPKEAGALSGAMVGAGAPGRLKEFHEGLTVPQRAGQKRRVCRFGEQRRWPGGTESDPGRDLSRLPLLCPPDVDSGRRLVREVGV